MVIGANPGCPDVRLSTHTASPVAKVPARHLFAEESQMTSRGYRTSGDTEGGAQLSRRTWLAAAFVGVRMLTAGRHATADEPWNSDKPYIRWLSELTGLLATPSDIGTTGVRVHLGATRVYPEVSRKLFESIRLGALIEGDAGLRKISPLSIKLPKTDASVETISFYDATSKPQVLRIGEPGSCTQVVVPVLEGRQTDVAIYRDANGWLQTAFFAPQVGNEHKRDTLQTLGEAQWLLSSRDRTAASKKLEGLPPAGRDDPIAMCLSAFIASTGDDNEQLRQTVELMNKNKCDLADLYVAQATLCEARELPQSDVEQNYRRALDAGLPLIGPFLEVLWRGTEGMNLEANRYGRQLREIGSHLVHNQLWSAWRPGKR